MTKREQGARHVLFWGVLCLLSAWAAGCRMPFRCFSGDLVVEMDPGMRSSSGVFPSVEVDAVGITSEEEIRWQNYSIDQYFEAGNRFRADAVRHTMRFSDSRHAPVTLKQKDAVWKSWKKRGARKLVLVANLPGVWESKPGALDGRRLLLPLDSNKWGYWMHDGTIKIAIKTSGLVCQTKMNE